jgi:hypothetical protein
VLGDGGDATPFCVSMTSKAMLNVLLKANSCVFPVVLHMDSTFKLNDNEFPLIVIGITDGAQQLHVLSISIVSHCTHGMYMKVLHGLKDLVPRVLPQVTLEPAYVMTNAEVVERKALLDVFPRVQPLMCYFHVKKACEEKLRGNAEKDVILKDIRELHSTLTEEEFNTKFGNMFNRWLPNSDNFALYFYQQWVVGEFKEWQIFRSSPGVATTNNAVESLVSIYTLKYRFPSARRTYR